MSKLIKGTAMITGALVLGGLGAWIGFGVVTVAGIERPPYEVISKHKGYEIRQYSPQIAAEADAEGDFKEATNRGFRKLADYIFGNNTAANGTESEAIAMTAPVIERESESAKIAMTAPVIERDAANGMHTITFIMPSKYTLQNIPKPNNPEVRLVEIPAKRYAVLRFSGWVGTEKSEKMKQRLMEMLKKDGLEHVGEVMLSQYNPPWTPPFMRRNEVLVELK